MSDTSDYDLSIEFLNEQWEAMFPSDGDIELTETELSEMAYAEAMGRYCGDLQ